VRCCSYNIGEIDGIDRGFGQNMEYAQKATPRRFLGLMTFKLLNPGSFSFGKYFSFLGPRG
jgi:hypothetical protein